MTRGLVNLGHGFWNVRCTMKIGGILNIGTHVSIVRKKSGRFLILDSYTLNGEIKDQVMGLTDDGRLVDAVLNLHPFHTLHCDAMARDFPWAKFYGSERHRRVCPGVPWEGEAVESPEVAGQFEEDLLFSLPQGIDYISADENVHAGSLLAYHPESGALHVDDTFNVLPVPPVLRRRIPKLLLHPTLKKALKTHDGALDEFCSWLEALGRDWAGVRALCAAHNGVQRFREGEFTRASQKASQRINEKLAG